MPQGPREQIRRDWKSVVIVVLCVLQSIVAVLSVIVSIVVLAGASFLGGLSGDMLTEVGATSFQSAFFGKLVTYLIVSFTGLGWLFLITSLIDFVGGILGIRATNRPSAMMPFLVCTGIGLAASVVDLVVSLANGIFSWPSLIGAISHAVLLALALLVWKRDD